MTDSGSTVDGTEVDEWFEQEDDAPEESAEVVTDPALKYAQSQLRVVREAKDYQLDYLQHALRPGRELIDISPTYQRRLRWPRKKKSLLIESLLLNIPVPPIFLFEKDYNEYEVIDGRQRLDAISSFLSNDYALSGLEYWPELNRCRFLDLPPVIQKGLLRRSLPAVVLLAESQNSGSDDLDVRRILFDRLNTGGIRLNPQELRNALYPGTINAMLIRLARSDSFTDTWGIPPYVQGEEEDPSEALLKNALFSTLADAELVLRFFALRDAVDHDRKGSLRLILDHFMKKNASLSDEKITQLEQLFTTTLDSLRDIFGPAVFRLKNDGRLSRPLYDALMIAGSRKSFQDSIWNRNAIKAALSDALADPKSYEILVGRGNTIGAVHERVELASRILSAEG